MQFNNRMIQIQNYTQISGVINDKSSPDNGRRRLSEMDEDNLLREQVSKMMQVRLVRKDGLETDI